MELQLSHFKVSDFSLVLKLVFFFVKNLLIKLGGLWQGCLKYKNARISAASSRSQIFFKHSSSTFLKPSKFSLIDKKR